MDNVKIINEWGIVIPPNASVQEYVAFCQERLKSLCDEINGQGGILVLYNFPIDQFECDVAGNTDELKEKVAQVMKNL